MSLAHQLEHRWKRWIGGGGRFLLLPLSWGYRLALWIRNSFVRSQRVDIPILCVGNIELGGTGKTPIVMEVARHLSKEHRVAIVSRGYRGQNEKEKLPIVVSRGKGPLCGWEVCGDEPIMLASQLPGVIVIAGKDRVAGARLAKEQGAELVILDDGFQHQRLKRDLDLVVVDGRKPLSSLRLFPAGTLREPLSALKRADLVAVTYTDEVPSDLGRYTQAHPFPITFSPSAKPHSVRGKTVGLFCAIGQPERFIETAEELGLFVVQKLILPDHAEMDPEKLAAFALRAKALTATCLVCTQKDWVKLPLGLRADLPIYPVHRTVHADPLFFWSVKNLLPLSTSSD